MTYVSDWERLSDAMIRVMAAAGLSKDEVQTDICRAIADGAVKIRGKLERHATTPLLTSTWVLDGKDFRISTEIKSEDLDWEKSRPVKPWMVRRESFRQPGYWDLEWVELSRTDVTNVLCTAGNQSESAQHASSETGATSRSRRPLGNKVPLGPGLTPTAGPQKPSAAGSARRRGAQPKKFEQARDAMRNDIQQRRRSVAEVKNMLEKNFAANYGVSRDTARKARSAVLSEFGED
jgi:hypothetical protein